MNKIILLILCCNLILSQDFIPENENTMNYTQIFFKWPQINNSSIYKLIINDDETIYTSLDNSIIINDFLWGEDYMWHVCGYDDYENLIDCYNTLSFTINDLPSNYPTNINVISANDQQFNPGITMLDFESLHFSVALDIFGNAVWFADRFQFINESINVTEFLNSGNIIGYGFGGKGYEFTIDSDIVFETSTDFSVHHSIHKTDNDTYFFIDKEIQEMPCPSDCPEGSDPIIEWRGDRFIEVDSYNNILWEWDTFDYLSEDEYNPMWLGNMNPYFDWTHSNSVYFDVLNNTVYISIRNLSRITAIDYSTKEILWNFGNPEFMETIFFDNYFGFSHQHSAQIYNDNILFFDNGRANEPELSRCLEIDFFENEEPNLVWEYVLPDSLLTLSRGECDRLENGNTLISAGRTGNVLEINNNEIVWHLNVKTENSSPLIDDLSVSIYRAQRIINLYPTAFSFQINNLEGSYGEYILYNNQGNVNFDIYNNGWVTQNFKYQLFDMNDNVQSEGEVNIFQNTQINVNIENSNSESSFFILKVFPLDNLDNFQEIIFINQIALGDFNDDFQVDILDVVVMINWIINNENYDSTFDLNSDSIINVQDIILLINIILN